MSEDIQRRIQARVDSAVALRRETEAQIADIEPPSPYEGVLIRDLPAVIRAEGEKMGFWRSRHDEPQAVGAELDLELRALAATSPQASAGYGQWCAGRTRVVPLAGDGTPLEPATGNLSQILEWWRPLGPYADCWPGSPSEPGGLYGLQLSGAGRDWYREVTTLRFPARQELKSAPLGADYNLLDSVPGDPDVWSDDGEYRGKSPEQKATLSARLSLVEHRAVPDPRRPTVRTWTGSVGSRSGQAALLAARGKPLATTSWLVWQWTAGMDLRLGNLRAGVRAVPALPAEGSIVELDGVPFKVAQFPPMTSAMPDFLLAELQKLKR